MTSASKLQSLTKQSRDTLDMLDVGGKFIMEERSKHEAARLIIETSLCVIVGIVFLGSFMLFIMPEISLLRDYSGVSLSMAMVGIAMTLYVFATRGFIPQAGFDKSKKQFWVCKLNSRGHARVVTYFTKTDVQGIFIRRPSVTSKEAALCARIRGKLVPITLIRGSLVDIVAAHRELCDVLHNVNIVFPIKPVVKPDARTPHPMQGVQANPA
jgi:hypothetical protein